MKLIKFFLCMTVIFLLSSCVENYSNGERIGVVTKFSKAGVVWDSWDGHLNITQTGMNTSGEPFEFSVDNDVNNQRTISLLDSAANYGWKIKIKYHQVWGFKNVCQNRGETNYFIDDVIVLDKDFTEKLQFNNGINPNLNNKQSFNDTVVYKPHKTDTIYVVIYKTK